MDALAKYRIGFTDSGGAHLTPERGIVGAYYGNVLCVANKDTATKLLCKAYHGLRDRTVKEARKKEDLRAKREAEARLRRFYADNTTSLANNNEVYSVYHDASSGVDYIMIYNTIV